MVSCGEPTRFDLDRRRLFGNPGPGGWGVVGYGGHEKELKGGEPFTTNNRMELTAAIEALQSLKRPCDVSLHTDSQYLRGGVTSWIVSWKRNGWRTADKKPVKNEDLWRRLDAAAEQHDIEWLWVKGHADDELNARADQLAGKAWRRSSDSGGRGQASVTCFDVFYAAGRGKRSAPIDQSNGKFTLSGIRLLDVG